MYIDLKTMNGTISKLTTLIAVLLLHIQIAISIFSCDGKISGYYADIETGCQVYHMCDGLGRQFSYTCPNATLFQQRMLICDHWYMVNCSLSEDDYIANSLIGQRKKPFVDDSAEQPYRRTPRPDLTTHPSETESDIIYRTGRAHAKTSSNLVGSDFGKAENDNKATSAISETKYAVPSHWSTEYDGDITTSKIYTTMYKSNNYSNITKKQYRTTTQLAPQSVTLSKIANPPERYNFPKNHNDVLLRTTEQTEIFGSYYNATTPVYSSLQHLPKLHSDMDIGLLPPLLYKHPFELSRTENNPGEILQSNKNGSALINFKSNFKATTPFYPTKSALPSIPQDINIGLLPPLEDQNLGQVTLQKNSDKGNVRLEEKVLVNFESTFKATTPVYQEVSELPSIPQDNNIGLLPPIEEILRDVTSQKDNAMVNAKSKETAPVNFESNFAATTPVYPKVSELPNILEHDDIALLPPLESKHASGVLLNQENHSNGLVNFESSFKATTPIYPKSSELPNIPSDIEIGLLPPLEDQKSETERGGVVVNFHSTFKATSPVYPNVSELSVSKDEAVGLQPPENAKNNGNTQQLADTIFPSSYNSTTPVYPEFIEPTSPLPQEIGLLPPIAINEMLTGVSSVPTGLDSGLPELESKYSRMKTTNRQPVMEPSKQYQPPKFEPDYTQIYNTKEKLIKTGERLNISEFLKTMNAEQWKTLRKELLIPDYEFPLDPISRPSYEGGLSSFQVKPVSINK